MLELISSPWLYLVVFLAVAVDGFLPVVPSETLVIGLGALSATGSPDVPALAVAVTLGGFAGDQVSYHLGRRTGTRFTPRRLAAARQRAEQALLRYGGAAILVGRFLPYGRTATTLMSGSVALAPARFRLFTLLASAAWAAYALGLGRLGGAAFTGSPLLGMGFGLLLGTVLAAVCAAVDRRRPTPASA